MAYATYTLRIATLQDGAPVSIVLGADEIVVGSLQETKKRSLILDQLAADTLRYTASTNWLTESQLEDVNGVPLEDVNGVPLYAYDSPYAGMDLSTVPYGAKVEVLRDGVVVATYYNRRIKAKSPEQYEGEAVNLIGLLIGGGDFMGGVYNSATDTVGDVIADIMGDLPYTIDADVAAEAAGGHIPICDRREALRQLLFPINAFALPMADGSLHFAFADINTVKMIPDDDVALRGSKDFRDLATEVRLTEHAYTADASVADQVIYSTAVSAQSYLVAFSSPMHSLQASGLTIEESGANYAIVSGAGTLSGKPYVHSTRIMSAGTGIVTGEANVKSFTGATMVNAINSTATLNRLKDYYSKAQELSREIYIDDDDPEELVSAANLTDTLGKKVTGYVEQMDTVYSLERLSGVKFITGWAPEGGGSSYNTSRLLTGSGTFTVPAGVTQMRVYIVGGGQSGEPGLKGQNGTSATGSVGGKSLVSKEGDGGDGGEGGFGGLPGKLTIVDLEVTPGQTFNYSCGAGGVSLTPSTEHVGGGEGGDSTFGVYSSSTGVRPTSGVIDPVTGNTYAVRGSAGYAGYKGVSSKGDQYSVTGPDGNVYTSGDNGRWWAAASTSGDSSVNVEAYAMGGLGGGPAVGGNGNDGDPYTECWTRSTSTSAYGRAEGTKGGTGATGGDGTAAATLGSGGNGANGGGGGGGGGNAYVMYHRGTPSSLSSAVQGEGGEGGPGGLGGRGGAGFILALYRLAS